jgi:mannose-6-phosphate isomerase-like protein (cupin superfamily)
MKRLVILFVATALVLTLAFAQTQDKKPEKPGKVEQDSSLSSSLDAYIVAPQAYKREFENERVRVTRVHYEPGEIIKTHDHPKLSTVYVYLRDNGPVRFIHSEDDIAVRPAVKAGGFRLGRAVEETHKVENISDQPSDFLRVELKNLTVDTETFRGRFPPETNQTYKNSEKIGFENKQLRIVRVNCLPRSVCPTTTQTYPYLLVTITPSQVKTATNNGNFSNVKMDLGQTIWVESRERFHLENPNNSPVKFLRIEFKVWADGKPK